MEKIVAYSWIIASLALPAAGALLIAQSGGALAALSTDDTYVVQPGDTLTAISNRYGVPIAEIVQANGLANPNRIYVGQTLVIPRQDQATGSQTYTIRSGESLAAIALRYDVSVEDILQANNLADRNSITAGQVIVIPADKAPVLSAAEATYIMQRGDSLFRISLIYGVSVDDLLAANSLSTPNAVYPGLVIRIPVPGDLLVIPPDSSEPANPLLPVGGRTYTVRPGDTLSRIAIANEVTVDGLVAANDLTSPNRIYAGQILSVPEAGAAARQFPAQTAVSVTVQPGDTLSGLAMRYGVTTNGLAVANGISDSSTIYVGQVLSIPSAQAGSNSVRYASMGDGLCGEVDVSNSGTGFFIRPVEGYVLTQRFKPMHSGVDLAANLGTLVYAADSGTVTFAGWNPAGYGNLIVLDHGNGWRTYYAHLSEINVACGDWIPRASIIGKVGSTGNSTGPHLHFEMLRFGVAVNPAGYIRF